MKKKLFTIEDNPIKYSRVSNYNQKNEDNFFCFNKKIKSLSVGINQSRVIFFFLFIVLCIAIFWLRLFGMQVVNHNKWVTISEGNRIRTEKQIPSRGVIYDRQGQILASNEANFALVLEKDFLQSGDLEQVEIFLTKNLIPDEAEDILANLDRDIETEQGVIILQENIQYKKALKLISQTKEYPFLSIYNFSARSYVDPNYGLSHVLGYTGKINDKEWSDLKKTNNYLMIDYVGKVGVEKEYEKYLRGNMGSKKTEIDASGQYGKVVEDQKSEPGQNLYLTIDAELNKTFTESLCSKADEFGGKAAGVALDPETGEILALVSCPVYDNNFFKNTKKYATEINDILQDEKIPLYNRVIQGEYPPGSIFKLIVASAALEEGIVDQYTKFLSVGGLRLGEWFYPDWKSGGHGMTNIFKAIYESVNTYFYYIGGGFENFEGLGMAEIINYARQFGLEKPTGVDLPGEQVGFLPTRDWKREVAGREWYIGDTYHLSIGQGDLIVTPLQLAVLTSYFANHGQAMAPHIFLTTDQNIHYQNKVIYQDIIDEDYMETVREGMRQTVTLGSGRYLSDLSFTAAGKTGTAQVGGGEPHAWFTTFAPFEEPEIVVTVLIENGVEGSSTAVPVVKDVLRKWWELKSVN